MALEDLKNTAKKAKGGDKEALGDLVLEAPKGLRGKEPKEFADEMADNEDAFNDEFGGEHEGPPWARESKSGAEMEEAETTYSPKEQGIIDVLSKYGVDAGDAASAAREIIGLDIE